MTTSTLSTITSAATRFPLRAMLLLGLGVLVTVTAESMPAGLLPEMSADLGVSAGQVGTLISVWAVTVIVTSLPLARLLAHRDRRLVIALSLAVFAVANLASAIAPVYGAVLATRIVAATAHGVFWAVVIVYASALLSPGHLARGLAIVTAGGTAATAIGLPAATTLAQLVGWRAAFAVLGGIAIVLALVVWRAMPRSVAVPAAPDGTRHGFLRDPSLPALAVFGVASVLIATAQFASFTYIRPYLGVAASVPDAWTAGVLFAYGAAGFLGVVAAGILGDRYPRAALPAVLLSFSAAFAVLSFAPGNIGAVVAALVVWGIGIGAVFPLLQTMLMRTATERTKPLASAGMVVLFNIGIALGPWLGAITGGAESPTTVTTVSAAAMLVAAALGAGGVVLAVRRQRH